MYENYHLQCRKSSLLLTKFQMKHSESMRNGIICMMKYMKMGMDISGGRDVIEKLEDLISSIYDQPIDERAVWRKGTTLIIEERDQIML